MDRKQLIREYKERRPDMGIYALISGATGRYYLGWSKDLRAILNRQGFMLSTGAHDNLTLLEDYTQNRDGFEQKILEVLEYDEKSPDRDYTDDLKSLLELWIENIEKDNGKVVLL